MPARTLNLGILAHVDAGKTSLTERLLYEHGAVAALGSVDTGSTTTDSGELERERGITIRSAVASFHVGDLRVNLIDTPGHPDFIAEVERALAVLDGAVLVLSAVEGVQAQTRVLMRSLRRLGLPTLIFVNKIDRTGARADTLLPQIRAKLGAAVIAMNAVHDLGGRDARTVARPWTGPAAETLADHDDDLLARLVDGAAPGPGELGGLLAAQTAAGLVHPVFFGSATTGQGTAELAAGVAALLRPRPVGVGETSGVVFAIERGPGGERVAYLRLFAGTLRERERVTFHRSGPGGVSTGFTGRVATLDVVGVDPSGAAGSSGGGGRAGDAGPVLTAGDIGRIRGLPGVRVGDRLGGVRDRDAAPQFSPPSLEALVRARRPGQEARLHAALVALADEDPLIATRAVAGGETSVLLYGAVQREVLAARLDREFGVAAEFGEIRPVFFERLAGTGEAVVELDPRRPNDFWATVGLRVEPGPPGAGPRYVRDVEWGALPRAFHRAVEETVAKTLDQGLYGWPVLDCTVTVIRSGYQAPISAAADFRGLTPVVLLRALRAAGTRVHEPCQAFEIELPAETLSPVLGRIAGLGGDICGSAESGTTPPGPTPPGAWPPGDAASGRDASPSGPGGGGAWWSITGRLPTRRVHELTAALPGLTHGEGAMWTSPGPDRRLRGDAPRRPRRDGDPLNYTEYLRFLNARRPGT